MIKEILNTDSRVEIHSTYSGLDGKTGNILGIASTHAECNFWIVGLDEPMPDRRAVVLIDSCLKLAN
jgi:hypothetical protein